MIGTVHKDDQSILSENFKRAYARIVRRSISPLARSFEDSMLFTSNPFMSKSFFARGLGQAERKMEDRGTF